VAPAVKSPPVTARLYDPVFASMVPQSTPVAGSDVEFEIVPWQHNAQSCADCGLVKTPTIARMIVAETTFNKNEAIRLQRQTV